MTNENKPEQLTACPLPGCGAEVTRLAEIGAFVDQIIDSQCDIDVQLFIGMSGRLVGLEDECGSLTSHAGDTLLASLRALAAEIGGES